MPQSEWYNGPHSHLRSFKTLDVITENSSAMLVESSLPAEISKTWQRIDLGKAMIDNTDRLENIIQSIGS